MSSATDLRGGGGRGALGHHRSWGATPTAAIPFAAGETIGFQTLDPGEQLHLRNDEDQPLVLLQVTLSADHPAPPEAEPHRLPKWPVGS